VSIRFDTQYFAYLRSQVYKFLPDSLKNWQSEKDFASSVNGATEVMSSTIGSQALDTEPRARGGGGEVPFSVDYLTVCRNCKEPSPFISATVFVNQSEHTELLSELQGQLDYATNGIAIKYFCKTTKWVFFS
jgi:hypothetical protein